MPPSQPVTMFQRGGYIHSRLTKLYSDTKQSYESADVTTAPPNVSEERPEVRILRRNLQIQQDRLLAWGLDWTDTNAAEARYHSDGDVEIDKQIDQAGLGDEVASVMSEIQRLLDETARLQHPERHAARQLSSHGKGLPISSRNGSDSAGIATGSTLLEQLTACIDVLYSLSASRKTGRSPNWSKKTDAAESSAKSEEPNTSQVTLDDEVAAVQLASIYSALSESLMFIRFDTLDLNTSPVPALASLPSYDQASLVHRDTVLGKLASYINIMVDFVPLSQFISKRGMPVRLDIVTKFKYMLQKMTSPSPMSHQGQLPLMGFSVDEARARVAFVYELPPTYVQDTVDSSLSLIQPETLNSVIAASYGNSRIPSPPLEDRFRLAYNLVISVLEYMTHGICHRHINSGNVLFYDRVSSADSDDDKANLRNPYLLPSAERYMCTNKEPLSGSIYRHPADKVYWNEIEIVPALEIYSLGLVLLEIGMFMPLAKIWKSKYDRTEFMSRVQTRYVQNLSSKCGGRYMRTVQKCLEAPETLINSTNRMGDAVRFLFGIVEDLSKCCTIDEEGPPPHASDIEYLEKLQQGRDKEARVELPAAWNPVADQPLSTIDPLKRKDSGNARITRETKAQAVELPSTTDITSKGTDPAPLRKWPELDIPQKDLDQWNTILMPRLSVLLQSALSGSPESSSVSLMMVGPSAEKARTTICIQCTDTQKVQDAIKRRFKAKKGWGVVVQKGKVRRSGRRKTDGKKGSANLGPASKVREQLFQEQPSCGASIGAFRDCEHLPPVSFGGTILVDGEPFGMTVHHMLDAPSDDEDEDSAPEVQRAAATREYAERSLEAQMDDLHFTQSDPDYLPLSPELELSDEDGHDDDDNSDASTIRPDYCAFDADGNEFWFLDDAPPAPRTPELLSDTGSDFEHLSDEDHEDDSESDNDAGSIGDRCGVDPWDDDELYVTQPAIDDVDEDFFPNDEDRDDDHLASHSFGYVYASSGIKRVVSDDMKHEVDWALIRVQEERIRLSNTIQQDMTTRRRRKKKGKSRSSGAGPLADVVDDGNPKANAEDEQVLIDCVASSKELSGTDVYCCGRSSGFRKGRISQAMALVKMYGRQSFSSSWCVEGGFGVPGDSGAWVYNPTTRELCGHVLAWGNKSKTAYIAPMDVLFADIKSTLGAEDVRLPGRMTDVVPKPTQPESNQEKRPVETTAEVKQQLHSSKDIEIALRGIKIGSDPLSKETAERSSAGTQPMRKDISPYGQSREPYGMGVTAEAAS